MGQFSAFAKHPIRTMRITKIVRNQILIVLFASVAGILTGVLGGFFVQNADLKNFLLNLSGNLVVSIIIFLFLQQGIKSLYPIDEINKLPIAQIIESIRDTKHNQRIRILDTFTELTDYPEFKDAVITAMKRKTKIDILLIHPHSAGAKRRAEQLKGNIDIIQEIHKSLTQLYALCSEVEAKYKDYVEVRLYSALPSISMHHCDDWAYTSLLPIGDRGDQSACLKVPMSNPFGSYIDNTFEQIWNGTEEAPTIRLEEHMELRLEPVTQDTPHPAGYLFAYLETNRRVPKECFTIIDHTSNPIYKVAELKDKISCYIDGKEWSAIPHILRPEDSQSTAQYRQALDLIEQRYGARNPRIGRYPVITHLENLTEINPRP
jgi:hypothetical protein